MESSNTQQETTTSPQEPEVKATETTSNPAPEGTDAASGETKTLENSQENKDKSK